MRRYGYAPGNYMNKCHHCQQVVTGADKRAVTCHPCAELFARTFKTGRSMYCYRAAADCTLGLGVVGADKFREWLRASSVGDVFSGDEECTRVA